MGGAAKVLWLARMLPLPLCTGDRIYSARLAEALARAGCEVRFVGPVSYTHLTLPTILLV